MVIRILMNKCDRGKLGWKSSDAARIYVRLVEFNGKLFNVGKFLSAFLNFPRRNSRKISFVRFLGTISTLPRLSSFLWRKFDENRWENSRMSSSFPWENFLLARDRNFPDNENQLGNEQALEATRQAVLRNYTFFWNIQHDPISVLNTCWHFQIPNPI